MSRCLFIYLIFCSLVCFFIHCSSDTEGEKGDDAGADTGIRTCRNSAQCRADEECVNAICVKKNPKDAEADVISDIDTADISPDIITDTGGDGESGDITDGGADIADITDTSDIQQEFRAGIISVYEGAAGECSNEEYFLKSVSGYSGMSIMSNGDFSVNSGAKFK